MYKNENSREAKAIRLAFENGEIIDIPVEYISHIHMNKFDKMFSLVNDNKTFWMDIANEVKVVIKESINNSGLGLSYDDMLPENMIKYTLIERLHNKTSLSAIAILDVHGNKELYYTKWEGDLLGNNEAQEVEIRENGDLVIVIK